GSARARHAGSRNRGALRSIDRVFPRLPVRDPLALRFGAAGVCLRPTLLIGCTRFPYFSRSSTEQRRRKAVCGVVGYTRYEKSFALGRLTDALGQLANRGPDEQGVYTTASVALGCVRLRVIDLESGRQPMATEDGSLVIVLNGEIHNHKQLRAELEARGHCFRTACDTEVVLHAFREWDIDCFARLRGMFAVALWNEPDRRLVLARDRLGIKPLYVWQHGADICFASEMKGVLVHRELERRVDLD